MLYLLYGPNEYAIQQTIAEIGSRLGDPEMAALNTTTLDGRRTSVAEVITTGDALPFLAQRRMVVVKDLLTRLDADQVAALGEYLARVPDTTDLVLVEAKIDRRSAIVKLAQQLQSQKRAFVRAFGTLGKGELVSWVQQRVQSKAGRIETRAAALLAELVGTDLHLLSQEVDKLLIYVGEARPVTVGDVETLCSYAPKSNIFHMVDALGRRDDQTALRLLHHLLDEGQAVFYLLVMITRQFRILLSIKDLEGSRTPRDEMRAQLKLSPFVVDKGRAQARNFSLAQLNHIYRRLVEIDVASKTGQMDPVLALDLFVVETCQERPSR